MKWNEIPNNYQRLWRSLSPSPDLMAQISKGTTSSAGSTEAVDSIIDLMQARKGGHVDGIRAKEEFTSATFSTWHHWCCKMKPQKPLPKGTFLSYQYLRTCSSTIKVGLAVRITIQGPHTPFVASQTDWQDLTSLKVTSVAVASPLLT